MLTLRILSKPTGLGAKVEKINLCRLLVCCNCESFCITFKNVIMSGILDFFFKSLNIKTSFKYILFSHQQFTQTVTQTVLHI